MRVYLSPFARWLLVIPVAIVAIFAIVRALFVFPAEPEGHALSHALPAIVVAVVAVGIFRTDATRRRGERFALGALAALSGAQLLEAFSTFLEYPKAGVLHDTTSAVSMLSLVGVVAGIAWALTDAMSGGRFPAWIAIAIVGVLGALFMKLVIGL